MAQRDISAYTRPRYIESPQSQTVYVGVLKTPSLTLNGDVNTTTGLLTWSNLDDNTTYYELYVSYNGGEYILYDDNIFHPQSSYQLVSTLNPGTYKFKIRATAVITDPDTYITTSFYSAFSNETFEFTVRKLSTPVIQEITGTSQYYWDAVEYAQHYQVLVNKDNVLYETETLTTNPTIDNPFRLDYNLSGRYYITTNARNSNQFLFHTSDTSTVKTYTIIQLETPILSEEQFTADPPVSYWNTVQYATGYDVYLNGVIVASNHPSTNYNYTEDIQDRPEVYDFNTYVKAVVSPQVDFSNPRYLTSGASNSITWGVLPIPEIHMEDTPGTDNRIYIDNWTELYNAQQLEIYDGNNLLETILVSPYYDLLTEVPRAFNIRIKAVSAEPTITDSDFSNSVSYIVSQLKSPTLYAIASPDSDVITLNWNNISNADKYSIYLNNELITTVFGTTYNITNVPVGNNVVYITAGSNYYKYLESKQSNIVRSIRNPTSEYLLKINNQNYEVALPFVFTETLDETMDTASISTVPLLNKEPFEAYSEVEIIIAGENEDNSFVRIAGLEFHMIIAQDEVEEVNIGTNSRYIHHLNLIERTKLLETELMPDFSITQPMEYIHAKIKFDNDIAIKTGDDFRAVWTDSSDIPLQSTIQSVPGGYGTTGTSVHISGINNRRTIGSLQTLYRKNNKEIPLPYETGTSFSVSGSRYWVEWIGSGHYDRRWIQRSAPYRFDSSVDWNIPLRKLYKYRPHNESYDPTNDEIIIGEYTDGKEHMWNISEVPVGEYDVILEVYLSDNDTDILIDKINDILSNTVSSSSKFEFMFNDLNIPNTKSKYFEKCRRYRLVWSNIVITSIPEYDETNIIPFESKSIGDAINKTLLVVNPVGIDRYTTPKYSLDPKFAYLSSYILDETGKKLNYYPCPELKFQNQKSLYEVLSEIGRLFYGIPRLGYYDEQGVFVKNGITFDILDPEDFSIINSEGIENQDTLETITSSIDNHNTGFVSDLSNVISDEYQEVFPAGNLWITPRSGSEADPLANKDNMAIVVDKPIYRIVDVLVQGFSDSGPISIIDFVNEASVFQSLNNNIEGKGLSLYYSMGDNKIQGLGQIPQATQTQAILGLSPDDYVISNIIEYATGTVSKESINPIVNSLQYKVIYVPYTDSKVYTEQSNISGLRNQNYKAMNQENNIITDSSFGKSAQTQVERLGNNSINKTFITSNPLHMPKCGNFKEFDGYKYYADSITYRFNNNGFEGTVSYSKNFNKINERIGIDALYRLYRIYADDFVDRSININRYCYLSQSFYSGLNIGTMENTDYQLLKDIRNSFNNGDGYSTSVIKPDSLYVRNMKSDGTRLQYNDYAGNLIDIQGLVLPVNYNKYGNSISFTAAMKDNFSAGITTAKFNETTKRFEPDIYNKQRIQHDARYVDTNGELSIMGLTLFRYNDDSVLKVSPDMYPLAEYITVDINKLNGAIYSEKINVQKDNRERIKFNYQLHFQTFDKNLTIHSALLDRLYTNDTNYSNEPTSVFSPVYVLFRGDVSKSSNIGNYPYVFGEAVVANVYYTSIKLSQQVMEQPGTYDGFALIWPSSGDILFSYRTPITIESGREYIIPEIFLNFSDKKVSYKQR